MKLIIERTMDLDESNGELQPCEKAKLFKVLSPNNPDNIHNIWTIEVNTIKELIELLNECEKKEQKHFIEDNKLFGLVIRRTEYPEDMIGEYPFTIEVYNYWRE